MKKMLVVFFAVLLASAAFGQQIFDSEDPNGSPLMPGDIVEVTNSESKPGYGYSDAWFHMYYQGAFLGEVHMPFVNQHFDVDDYPPYHIIGYADLYVGPYTWADEVELEIALYLVPYQYHYYSRNSLVVFPTTDVVPVTSFWGLIALLILVPAVIIWRR